MTAVENVGGVGRGAAMIVTIRAVGLALGLGVALVLGRTLGVAGYGDYATGVGIATIVAAVTTVGAGPVLVRGTAAYLASGQAALLRGLLTRSTQVVLGVSTLGAVGLALVLTAFARPSGVRGSMIAAAPLIPLIAVAALGQASLQGSRRLAQAFAPTAIVRPIVFLAILVPAAAGSLSPAGAVLFQGVATASGLGLTLWWASRALPRAVRRAEPAYANGLWARGALGLGISSAVSTVTTSVGVTLVGMLRGGGEAGLLSAATRVSVLVMLASWASNESLAPVVAGLHQRRERSQLQRQITTVSRYVACATLAVAIAVALLAEPLLSLFGSGFAGGAAALRLLCLAAVVNAAAFGNMTVLMMTGRERSAAAAAVAGLVTMVAVSLALIPAAGATGAAAGVLGGTSVRNFVACWFTWTRLGIDSSVVGRRALD